MGGICKLQLNGVHGLSTGMYRLAQNFNEQIIDHLNWDLMQMGVLFQKSKIDRRHFERSKGLSNQQVRVG